MSDPILAVREVSLTRGATRVLERVSLSVAPAEIVTVIGPNGAGKSSLLKLVVGSLTPDSGAVALAPGTRVGYVPQRLAVDTTLPLTVQRFLQLGRVPAAEALAAARRLEIEPLLGSDLAGLSGGELQRALLARALLRRPQLLVLDEPTQGVDVTGQAELYRLIGAIRHELGCGVLMVSHDLHLVMASTDSVICLNRHICCAGAPDRVSRHPDYLRLFGRRAAAEIAVYTHQHDHTHPPGEHTCEGEHHHHDS